MTRFDTSFIKHLMKLCRISCSEDEIATLVKNLQSISAHLDSLQDIDTTEVVECSYIATPSATAMREDCVDDALPLEIFLKNSPSNVSSMVRVPPVIPQS